MVYNEPSNEDERLGLALALEVQTEPQILPCITRREASLSPQLVLKRFKMSASDPNKANPNSGEEESEHAGRGNVEPQWRHHFIVARTVTYYYRLATAALPTTSGDEARSLETLMGKINRIDMDRERFRA